MNRNIIKDAFQTSFEGCLRVLSFKLPLRLTWSASDNQSIQIFISFCRSYFAGLVEPPKTIKSVSLWRITYSYRGKQQQNRANVYLARYSYLRIRAARATDLSFSRQLVLCSYGHHVRRVDVLIIISQAERNLETRIQFPSPCVAFV